MKKLAYIIAFFALLGYAQNPQIFIETWKPYIIDEEKKSQIINIWYLWDYEDYWHIDEYWVVDSIQSINFPIESTYNGEDLIIDEYFYDVQSYESIKVIDFNSTQLLDTSSAMYVLSTHDNKNCIGKRDDCFENYGFSFLIKNNFQDSLWLASKNYKGENGIDFRNDFMEWRKWHELKNKNDYLDTIYHFNKDSTENKNFSLNVRRTDSLFFVYKKDTSFAVCYNNYECFTYLLGSIDESDTICTNVSDDQSQCLEGYYTKREQYRHHFNKSLKCYYGNESKVKYFISKIANKTNLCPSESFLTSTIPITEPFSLKESYLPPNETIVIKSKFKEKQNRFVKSNFYNINGRKASNKNASGIYVSEDGIKVELKK